MASLPSERSFGFFFACVFAIAGVYGWIMRPGSPTFFYGCLSAALVALLVTLTAPRLLAPLNKAWFLLGEMMGKVGGPIVLGIIFFGLLTPISLVTRLFGRDELRLKKQAASSYWVDRLQPGPASDSFKNQF